MLDYFTRFLVVIVLRGQFESAHTVMKHFVELPDAQAFVKSQRRRKGFMNAGIYELKVLV